jgi:choline-sulfatase
MLHHPLIRTLSVCALAATGLLHAASRPNVLVILTDEQFAEALSCRQGDRYLRTPQMDSLAARGVSFTRAYVANPLCVPSRTALLTGRYPHETGVQTNEVAPFDTATFPTVGTYFQRAGYDTGYVGKWHLNVPAENSSASGFNYAANLIRNTKGGDVGTPPAAAEFLQRKRNQPFLLFVSFLNPHNICEWARNEKLPDGDIGPPPPPRPVHLLRPIAPRNTASLRRSILPAGPMCPHPSFPWPPTMRPSGASIAGPIIA